MAKRDEKTTLEDGRVVCRRLGEDGVLLGERVEQDGKLVREEWWQGGVRLAVVEPGKDAKTERYRGFSGQEMVVEGETEATLGLEGAVVGTWSVFADGKKVGEAPFDRVRLEWMGLEKAQAVAFAPRLMRWAAAPVPALLADIVGLDWSEREGFFSNGPQLPFILTGLAFDDDDVFARALSQLRMDAVCQNALSGVAGAILTAMFRVLPALPRARQDALLQTLIDCWIEASDHFNEVSAPFGGTVFGLYAGGRSLLAEVAAGASTEELRSLGKRLVNSIDANAKEPQIAAILDDGVDAVRRCEAILALHKHPDLTQADYVRMLDTKDPLVRTVAAYFCITRFQKSCPEGAITALLAAAEDLPALSARFAKAKFAGLGLVGYVTRGLNFALFRTPARERAVSAIPHLLQGFTMVADAGIPKFVEELLGLTFGNCELPFAPAMLEVLGSITEVKDIRPLAGHLKNFALPTGQADLAALVARLRESKHPDADLHAFMHGKGE